jgi:hypothetical protein
VSPDIARCTLEGKAAPSREPLDYIINSLKVILKQNKNKNHMAAHKSDSNSTILGIFLSIRKQ